MIVAVPALTAVTTPLLTVATLVFDDDHVTFLLVALFGNTVAVNVLVCPTVNVALLSLNETLVTGTVVDDPPPLLALYNWMVPPLLIYLNLF